MSNITPQMVKELREKTGAGMMDCKKALVENQGDFEKSVDWLREKGLAAAAKKSDRQAAEGLVSLAYDNNSAVLVELNAETDFVARNDKFLDLLNKITTNLLEAKENDLEKFKAVKLSSGKTVEEEIQAGIAVIGENLNLRRIARLSVDQGIVSSYVHNAVQGNMGKIGVIIAVETPSKDPKVAQIAKQIAMHIAATKPESLNIESLDQSLIEREKAIFTEQARASGKPDSIIEKMVEGRIRKFYEEVVLLEQIFVIDGKTKISDLLQELSKEINAPVKISNFVRFALGEGVEKKESDFAAEVAQAAGK